jgi:hypothetical protein
VEFGKLGIISVVVFADFISGLIAVNLKTLERVSHHKHAAGPGVIKTAILVAGVLRIIRLKKVVRAI